MAKVQIQKADYVDRFAQLYLASLKKEKGDVNVCELSRKEMAKELFGPIWERAAGNQEQKLINHVNGLLDLLRQKVGEKKGLLTDDGKPTEALLQKMPDFKRTRVVETITNEQVDNIIGQLFGDDF